MGGEGGVAADRSLRALPAARPGERAAWPRVGSAGAGLTPAVS